MSESFELKLYFRSHNVAHEIGLCFVVREDQGISHFGNVQGKTSGLVGEKVTGNCNLVQLMGQGAPNMLLQGALKLGRIALVT